ncbi:CDP-diacylglycerol--serine O-phosphatidyltransferase [uncultured Porphyromonas sp.]|uniref:CDP-diacylglycerol--serine O-phosphatidyltransferase n=1 Tax=uncultured Porphyromonas sp. TaxID=159274 RepID=UPI00261CABBC|nr:CDP-diacylglycerol--serine O-phosphatidyltransferase [uncultured Porphyromonas sp.]
MSIKKHIPNIITCANLLSGVLAIVYTLQERSLECAAWCIVLAAVFDFFDGLVARALGVTSPIGKDLDSLADVVSFGVAPALLVYQGLSTLSGGSMLAYGVFILPAFAALRLAKFNHDERQTMSFLGLPVPSNALFWIGASFALESIQYTIGSQLTLITYLVLAVLFSALMVSDLPMFSFKLKKAPLKALWRQILLVIIAIAAILTRGWFGCSLTIIAYVFLSLLPVKEE